MIEFYKVDTNYTAYLQQYDRQIPNISYHTNNKFVCGIVLHINGFNYYAPISSKKDKQQTNCLITDHNGRVLSSIKFSFMFPANLNHLKQMDFNNIMKNNVNYYNLLLKEYQFCKSHEQDILEKARKVYRIGCNPHHPLNKVCCNFKLLEQKYLDYENEVIIC